VSSLVLGAYAKLVEFDFYLARRNFAALYNRVRSTRSHTTDHPQNQPSKSATQWIWHAFGTGRKSCACSVRRLQRVFSGDTAFQQK